MSTGDVGMTASFLPFSSCWLSLEGGLLYAFVGPAAVIVLVRAPFSILGGRWPQRVIISFCLLPDLQLPPGGVLAPRAPGDPLFPTWLHPGPQVNMLIGIIVFNKLMARDGVSDKSKKQRAG